MRPIEFVIVKSYDQLKFIHTYSRSIESILLAYPKVALSHYDTTKGTQTYPQLSVAHICLIYSFHTLTRILKGRLGVISGVPRWVVLKHTLRARMSQPRKEVYH